ncbi:hypothetical protein D3C73_1177440 [compost metagenome]
MLQVGEHLVGPHRFGSVRILGVRQPFGFDDVSDRVEPEAVDSFFQPPGNHLVQLVDNGRVLPVQIGLKPGIQMKVILVRPLIVLPDRAAEIRFPVVRRAAVPAFSPYIKITLRIVLRLP